MRHCEPEGWKWSGSEAISLIEIKLVNLDRLLRSFVQTLAMPRNDDRF